MSKNIIVLHDVNNNKLIGTFDITDVNGKLMDYYYYYFDGYKNYISYLLKRGAVRCDDSLLDKKYSQSGHKVIPIYEIKEEQ